MQKRAVQFTKKPYLPLFLSETADKFARDYAIKKSFRHALHLVTAHLHLQNQVAHALRTRDFWLASLSIHFPIHFAWRAHEYPVTLSIGHSKTGRKLHRTFRLESLHDCISDVIDMVAIAIFDWDRKHSFQLLFFAMHLPPFAITIEEVSGA